MTNPAVAGFDLLLHMAAELMEPYARRPRLQGFIFPP